MNDEGLAAELNDLRERHTVALHTMHQNELAIQRLENILGSCVLAHPLVTDAATSTSLDFCEEVGLSNEPYLQLSHLEAQVRFWQAHYEEIRMKHSQQVTQLTREGLHLMALLGKDLTEGFGDGREAQRLAEEARIAMLSDPSGFGLSPLPGVGAVERLPLDGLVQDEGSESDEDL